MLLDQNNLEIPPNSIIHCLGSLFQVSDQGLKHVVGKKIDSDTYFADSDTNKRGICNLHVCEETVILPYRCDCVVKK